MANKMAEAKANLQRLMKMAEDNTPGKTAGTEAERSARRVDTQKFLQPTNIPYPESVTAASDSVRLGLKKSTPTLTEQARGAKAKTDIVKEGIMFDILTGKGTEADSLAAYGFGGLKEKAKAKVPETIADIRKRMGTPSEQAGDKADIAAADKETVDPKAKKYNNAVEDLAIITEKQGKLNAGEAMSQEVFDSMEDWEKTIAGIKVGDKIDEETAKTLNGLYDRMKKEPESIIAEHDAEVNQKRIKINTRGMNKNYGPDSPEYKANRTLEYEDDLYSINPATGKYEIIEEDTD